jgi:hypothetical protein
MAGTGHDRLYDDSEVAVGRVRHCGAGKSIRAGPAAVARPDGHPNMHKAGRGNPTARTQ